MAEKTKTAGEDTKATGDPTGGEAQEPETQETQDGQNPEEGQEKGKVFTQAEVDLIIKERLERERKKAEREAAKAKKEAEEKALEDQAEWQKLAETRQATISDLEERVAELEPFKDQAQKYEKALAGFAAEMLKGVPDHIKALLGKMDVVDQLEWYTENKDALGQKAPSLPQTPKPANGQKMTEEERRAKSYQVRF